MKVTITFTDPPGGTATYTEVTSYSNDGKVMKLTGKNAAGEVVTVEYNWAFIISVTIVNTG